MSKWLRFCRIRGVTTIPPQVNRNHLLIWQHVPSPHVPRTTTTSAPNSHHKSTLFGNRLPFPVGSLIHVWQFGVFPIDSSDPSIGGSPPKGRQLAGDGRFVVPTCLERLESVDLASDGLTCGGFHHGRWPSRGFSVRRDARRAASGRLVPWTSRGRHVAGSSLR